MRTFVAYVPVLHEGYRRFFCSYEGAKRLFIIGPSLTSHFSELRKEIRELDPFLMREAILSLGIFEEVEVLDEAGIIELGKVNEEIVLPDEDVSRTLAEKYLASVQVTYSPIFLRWDKHNALQEKPIVPQEQITKEELHKRLMALTEEESKKSSDNWRHVGGLVSREGKVLMTAHNAHLPSEHTPYVNGDPRNNFHKGDHIEYSSALHAEACLISEAAKQGIALEGCDMYVTVFPCPPCAKLIACAGIKTLYCGGGYGVLDGEDILRSKGTKIIYVE